MGLKLQTRKREVLSNLCQCARCMRVPLGQAPAGTAHIEFLRLPPILWRLGIDFRVAFMSWSGHARFNKPVHSGVLVAEEDAPLVRSYLATRHIKGGLKIRDYEVIVSLEMPIEEYQAASKPRRKELRRFLCAAGALEI